MTWEIDPQALAVTAMLIMAAVVALMFIIAGDLGQPKRPKWPPEDHDDAPRV